ARARPAGVGHERGPRGLRRHVHLPHVGRVGPRGRNGERGAGRGARAWPRDPARPRERPRRDTRRAGVPRLRARSPRVIVRWSLAELPDVLAELGLERPLLVASPRWAALDVPRLAVWLEVPSHRIDVPAAADSLLAVGGGSAIDTAKAASAAA